MDVVNDVTIEQIEQVCATFSDSPKVVMEIARLRKMTPYGVAWKHLSYFLDGPGPRKPMTVDLGKLWREDEGVRKSVTMAILTDRRFSGARLGQVDVQQRHYQNQDWKLALGAFRMSWSLLPNDRIPRIGIMRFPVGQLVRIWFTDVYDWHPEDISRPTRCVHEAAQKLIDMKKAATFVMTGSAEVVLERYDLR